MQDYDFFSPYLFYPENYNEFTLLLDDFMKNYHEIDVKSIKDNVKERYSWSKSYSVFNNIFNNG